MNEVTRILKAIDAGDAHAAEQLLPMVYEELRKLAAAKLVQENPGQTLQATALVHEAYIRLVDVEEGPALGLAWPFLRCCGRSDAANPGGAGTAKARLKRGGELVRHELHEFEIVTQVKHDEIIAIDEALEKLEAQHAAAAQLVKLRYFAGMTIPECAEALGISSRKADQLWAYARAWLLAEMGEAPA